MLIGTNLVQNEKWDEPIEYNQIYFEYPGDAELKDYGKTKKDGDKRTDVTLNGTKWAGKQPANDVETDSSKWQSEDGQQLIKTLHAEALNKLQELYPSDEPLLKLLQFASKGLNQQMQADITTSNRSVDKAVARERMVKTLMASLKITRPNAEKRVDAMMAAEDTEEAAA